jgi:hypothetical protein
MADNDSGGVVGAFGGEWFGGTAYDAVANESM